MSKALSTIGAPKSTKIGNLYGIRWKMRSRPRSSLEAASRAGYCQGSLPRHPDWVEAVACPIVLDLPRAYRSVLEPLDQDPLVLHRNNRSNSSLNKIRSFLYVRQTAVRRFIFIFTSGPRKLPRETYV